MSDPERPQECKEIFAQLSAYLDLDLPEDACAHIERHIAGCPPCVAFVESLRKTIAICREYRPEELPAALSRDAREALLAAYRKALKSSTEPS